MSAPNLGAHRTPTPASRQHVQHLKPRTNQHGLARGLTPVLSTSDSPESAQRPPPDRFRGLRHHCVAQCLQSRGSVRHGAKGSGRLPFVLGLASTGGPPMAVQPGGNPISASTHAGFSGPFGAACSDGVGHATAVRRFGEPSAVTASPGPPRPSCAVAVGHIPRDDEQPLTAVRRSDRGSGEHVPRRIIPERGQVTEHESEPGSSETWHVLSDDEAGSNHANEPCELGPEPSLIGLGAALSCDADRLAGESSTHHLHLRRVHQRPHVLEPLRVRPVLREHRAAPRVYLALPRHGAEAGALQAELEASDAREERADAPACGHTHSIRVTTPVSMSKSRPAAAIFSRSRSCSATRDPT